MKKLGLSSVAKLYFELSKYVQYVVCVIHSTFQMVSRKNSRHYVYFFGNKVPWTSDGRGGAFLSVVVGRTDPWGWVRWVWSIWLLKILSFLDPQETVQWQHVRGQVCCISPGIRRVSSPKLQNTPSLRQKQRPGATGTTYTRCFYCFCLSTYCD